MSKKVLALTAPKEVTKGVDVKSLVERAKSCYIGMQRSWWEFAKAITQIQQTESYADVGFESLRDFCEHEYPTLNFSTITKYTKIVENFHDAIEARIAKEPEYKLPAYESCYMIGALKEDSAPKEEVAKLRKAILDNKISYYGLRDKLSEIIAKRRKELGKPDDTDVESSLAKELEEDDDFKRDLTELDDESGDFLDSVDDDEDSEEDEEDMPLPEEEDGLGDVKGIKNRVSYLLDNLPALEGMIKKSDMTDTIFELSDDLQKLEKVIGKFLDKIEKLQS